MSEIQSTEDAFEPTTTFLKFVKTLDGLISNNSVIIEGYCSLSDSAKVRSAKAVHKKTIGRMSWDHQTIYLFPDVLIKQMKKQNTLEVFPRVLGRKKKLWKELIRGGLINRRLNDHIENHALYNGVLVEAWPIDAGEFKSIVLNIIL